MAVLTYDDLVDSVNNISRKYARNCAMDQEDMAQEIWVHLYSLDKFPEDIRMARTIMINKAIDLSRKEWNIENRNIMMDFHNLGSGDDDAPSFSDDMFVFQNEESDNHSEVGYDKVESEMIVRNMMKDFTERERKYVVSKAYLSCGLEFLEDDFLEIIKDLSAEAKETLMSSAKGDTDDTILKLILGIKTGTNSGSIRSIKNSLWKKFSPILAMVG